MSYIQFIPKVKNSNYSFQVIFRYSFVLFKYFIMKKFYVFLLIATGLLAMNGCKFKDKNPIDNPVKSMSDLVISNNFNWRTTKTIPVAIKVPAESRKQILRIYSIDNQNLLYAGYADTATGMVNTKITIPTNYNMVKMVYGNSFLFKPITIGVGNDLDYDYNAFKEAKKTIPCDLSSFITYTQNDWAVKPSGKNAGYLLAEHFKDVFPKGLVIGSPKGHSIVFTSANAVSLFLPQGGPSVALKNDYKNPSRKSEVAGMWGGLIAAAMLDVEFNRAGYLYRANLKSGQKKLKLGELIFKNGTFKNWTIDHLIFTANKLISGDKSVKYSIKDISNALEMICRNFNFGNNLGYFTCPTTVDCGCKMSMETLTLKYNGKKPAHIKVRQWQHIEDVDTTSFSNLLFSKDVNPGETFSFHGNGDGSLHSMNNGINIYINNKKDVSIRTTCYETLFIGGNYGSFTIEDGTSYGGLHLCKGIVSGTCGCDGGLYSLAMRYGGMFAKVMVKEEGTNAIIYNGTLSPGKHFSFTGSGQNGKIASVIDFYENGKKVATMKTLCKDGVKAGNNYGDFTVIAGSSDSEKPLCHSQPLPGTTTTTQSGTLVYEDLWPYTGDYDFNDLVINYKFAVTKDINNYVRNITGTFVIEAFGASFHNGFGFQLPHVLPNQIIDVTGYDIAPNSIFTLSSNGLEAKQSKATAIVFDDCWRLMKYPGIGVGVNTEMDAPYIQPDTITMQIDFYKDGKFAPGGPVKFSTLDIGDFNPFLIVNQQRSIEIHLPDYAPTDLADTKLLGTGDDNSIPGKGRYYKTEKNLPWAINIPMFDPGPTEKTANFKTSISHYISEPFLWPIEKQEIVHAYYHFADWAESSGEIYPNWYTSKPGYRNDKLIYMKHQ